MDEDDLPLTTTCQVGDVQVLMAVNKVSSNQHHTIRRVRSGMAVNIARLWLGTRWGGDEAPPDLRQCLSMSPQAGVPLGVQLPDPTWSSSGVTDGGGYAM